MRNSLMDLADKALLRKRAIIETIYDRLKYPNFQRRGLRLLLGILADARRRKIGVGGVCGALGRLMGKPQTTNDSRSRHDELE